MNRSQRAREAWDHASDARDVARLAARAVEAAECRASIAHGRAGAARRSVGRATLASLSAWERAESAAVLAAADADALVAAARKETGCASTHESCGGRAAGGQP